ncbi:cell wall metabolism sensor histidine kinase WalK [bacterium LRH843]|nr:cell wall metabolism sensor histidine kinase WalK [bacterium LRH843]
MLKTKYRLIVAIGSVTLLVMVSLVIIIGQLYESFYLNNLTERLKKEAELTAFLLEEEGLNQEVAEHLAMEVSTKLDARITILLKDGTVIGESDLDPHLMEKHNTRPEIRTIISGEEKEVIRYSETENREMLYYAVSIKEDQETIGFVRLGLPMTYFAEKNHIIWGVLIVTFALAFIVIVTIAFRITNQMIRPIEEVTVVANKLAEGNFKARAAEESHDEIGLLTRSINVLAYNLEQITGKHQAQQERMETLIENMGSGLILVDTNGEITLINRTCRDIFNEQTDSWMNQLYYEVIQQKEINKLIQIVFFSEEKQRKQIQISAHFEMRHFDVYGAPIISKDGRLKGIAIVLHEITELKKLELIRKDFIANVSHELKTPVTSIKGFAETLLDGAMHTAELREQFLTIIYKESERLQGLIYNLLELSKMEQEYFKLNWQSTDLRKILEEVVALLNEKAKEKQVELTVNVEGDTSIEGDPERLEQILINLINNGVTYTPSGGRVMIFLKGFEQDVEVKIIDTGVGIAQNDLPRIFERFYRVDRARSRNSGGTGLGLAIVKHLVEVHEGHIHVESRVGKGTTFTITFKRRQLTNE